LMSSLEQAQSSSGWGCCLGGEPILSERYIHCLAIATHGSGRPRNQTPHSRCIPYVYSAVKN
jgi:hypothetical protein